MGEQECGSSDLIAYDSADSGLFIAAYNIDDAYESIRSAILRISESKGDLVYPYKKWAEVQLLYSNLTDVLTDLEELMLFSKKHFGIGA